jgi:hypothetical protein
MVLPLAVGDGSVDAIGAVMTAELAPRRLPFGHWAPLPACPEELADRLPTGAVVLLEHVTFQTPPMSSLAVSSTDDTNRAHHWSDGAREAFPLVRPTRCGCR